MSDIAIQADCLSKVYQIGVAQRLHNTLRDQIVHGLGGLFQRNGQKRVDDREFWALKDVSFEVRRGEVIGIIGRNGAGKSTLLKILSRITEPTSGQARIYGRVGSLLEVGTGFHGELTGRDNVYLSGAILGMTKRETDRKFDEIVSFAEIEKFVDTPVKRYSSGMYMRLAFAVAAHLETEILLVDEVLAVGDAAFQKKCLGQMEEAANKQGRTVVLVSHNMAVIENRCQRVIWIANGRVAHDGPPQEGIAGYLASLSGLSRMSIAERADRTGLGQIRAVALELLDNQGNPVTYPKSGQELVFRLHYRCDGDKVYRNCVVSLVVRQNEGIYFNLSTDLVDNRQLDLRGSDYVDLVVPELPLSASEYDLSSYIQAGGEVQDWLLGAASMSVVDGDFYGTGRNYRPGWRGRTVLVKHWWSQGNGAAFEEGI